MECIACRECMITFTLASIIPQMLLMHTKPVKPVSKVSRSFSRSNDNPNIIMT